MAKHTFDATLNRPDGVGTWTYFDIPLDMVKLFRAKGQVRIMGTINGHPFRTSARPHGNGSHYVVGNKSIGHQCRPEGVLADGVHRCRSRGICYPPPK